MDLVLFIHLFIQHRMSNANKDQVSNTNKRNGLNKREQMTSEIQPQA